jgi:uncharacterized protein YndB with AHSA1/START domain
MTPGFEHVTTIDLPASPARVFQALTEPGELRQWFATDAAVEPRLGGAYRFWGTATIGAPREPDPAQVVTAFEPGRRLGFAWTIHGAPTQVDYALAPGATADETKLEIRHAVRGALPFRNPVHAVSDLWRIHGGNLGDHLRGTTAVVLPDFASDAPEVRASIEIAAPPAKVFRALLDPALMNQWLGTTASRVDVATGEYVYGWSYPVEGRQVAGGPTRILEMVENRKLVTDWPDWRGDPDKPVQTITWLLDPIADGRHTRVTLVHSGFEYAVDRSDYQQGWGFFLDGLARVAAA